MVNKYEHYCKYLEHFMYKLLQAFKIISDNKESNQHAKKLINSSKTLSTFHP